MGAENSSIIIIFLGYVSNLIGGIEIDWQYSNDVSSTLMNWAVIITFLCTIYVNRKEIYKHVKSIFTRS